MVLSSERPVICPILVGRVGPLVLVNQLLDQVEHGDDQTLLVTGEAGIGKSRLVAEARTLASQRGFVTLQGACFEQDQTLAYAPLRDLMRSCLASSPSRDPNSLGYVSRHLALLVPELAVQEQQDASPWPLEPQQQRERLFQAIISVLAASSASRPLLVTVEDLHWCDDASLELLLHLARRSGVHPLLLLLTYRNDEVDASLRHFLAELDRARLAKELVLDRLSIAEVSQMLQAIFDLQRPVRSEFLNVVYELTEGNPFFVEEMLKSLPAAGDSSHPDRIWDSEPLQQLRIPRTIHDAVQRRVAKLSDEARDTLTVAAAFGRRVDFSVLQILTGQQEQQLLRILKELKNAQLVIEESAEEFAFRHALTRESIYSELLVRERQILHHQIAAALEKVYANDLDAHAGDLAYHFYEGGEWGKTREYALRAGQQAQALFAPRAASEHFTRALEASRHLAEPPSPHLFLERGLAYETFGDFERALADYETALRISISRRDRETEWQTLLDIGFLWESRDYSQTGVYHHQALRLAEEIGDAAKVAHTLNRVGNWLLNIGQPLEALRRHEQALHAFQRLSDRHGLGETFDLLGMTELQIGDLFKSKGYYEQAVRLFQELDDRRGLVSSLASLAATSGGSLTDTEVPALTFAEARPYLERALGIAREIDWRSGESYCLWVLGMCLGVQGEYGRALDAAHAARIIAEETGHRQWLSCAHSVLGAVFLDLLALPQARWHLEQALSLAQSSSWSRVRHVRGLLASTYIRQGELTLAESTLDAVLGPNMSAEMATIGQRTAWLGRAELALARGDPDSALHIADTMTASALEVSATHIVPRLEEIRGEALTALKRHEEAETALLAAKQAALAEGTRGLLWRLYVGLGLLYRRQGRREAAQQAHSAARDVVHELAGSIPDEALRITFLSAVAGMLPPAAAPSPRQAAKQRFGGLTRREQEVAALIARGESNRAIAEQLVLSERTVEDHVSNVLSKLDLKSRVQIAAWAIEHGLHQ